MDSLYEILTIEDLDNKIKSTKIYIENIKTHAQQMKAFLPLFQENWRLPIKQSKYKGKIAYIDWILRSDELYLSLNVAYHSTGTIKSVEAVSQLLTLEEIGDIRNVVTLSGKRFKRKYIYDKTLPVYTVLANRVISPETFAIIENGMENFAQRERMLRKFGLQSQLFDV